MTSALPPALAAWQKAGSQSSLLGQHQFTRVEGDGPALLLLHGFPTASFDWAALWPELTRHFRVHAIDLLGFGFSAKPTGHHYRIADQADRVEAFLADEGVSEYRLLAHDVGDTVAQELLARQIDGSARQRLLALCLLNGGLFPETHRALPVQRLLASPFGPLLTRLMTRERFIASLQGACLGQLPAADAEAMWLLLEHNQGRRVMPKLIGYMAERRHHRARWVGALQQSPLPLRLVVGLDDPISGAHMLARYRELVPQPDTVGLDGVGHYPQVEAPARVLAAVLPFLTAPQAGEGRT